jgi:hypothetical protein
MGVKLGNGKWAIKEDKLLAYNDNSGRFFNKEFDFSRGSSATYVAKDGLIKTAGLQATNLVNNGDFSELGSELITNGDFSDGGANWNYTLGVWDFSSGLASCNGTQSGLSYLNQSGAIVSGKVYKATYEIKSISSGEVRVFVGDVSGTARTTVGIYTEYITASSTNFWLRVSSTFIGSIDNVSVKQVDPNDYWTLGTGWSFGDGFAKSIQTSSNNYLEQTINTLDNNKLYKVSFNLDIISSTTTTIGISNTGAFGQLSSSERFYTTSGTKTFNALYSNSYPNYIRFVGGIGTEFNISNISVQEIQADTPRIDFSDSVKGALLLEPQSTNLLQYSEDLSQTNKVINNGTNTVTSNYAISPDGTNTADRLVAYSESGSSEFSLRGILHNTSVAESYTHSVWLKSNTGLNQNVIFYGRNVQGPQALCEVTNEWKRFNFTGSSNTTNYFAYLGTRPEYGSDNNIDILVWGMQLEAKSFVTSYIPNHGVSGGVTRLADVCINSGTAQDFNDNEGVFYAEIASLSGDTSVRQTSISNGSDNECVKIIWLFSNQIRLEMKTASGSDFVKDVTVARNGDFYKLAIQYKSNDYKVYVNGISQTVTQVANTPSGLVKLNLALGNGAGKFSGKVREIQVFTESLTDEQLQKLTTI